MNVLPLIIQTWLFIVLGFKIFFNLTDVSTLMIVPTLITVGITLSIIDLEDKRKPHASSGNWAGP